VWETGEISQQALSILETQVWERAVLMLGVILAAMPVILPILRSNLILVLKNLLGMVGKECLQIRRLTLVAMGNKFLCHLKHRLIHHKCLMQLQHPRRNMCLLAMELHPITGLRKVMDLPPDMVEHLTMAPLLVMAVLLTTVLLPVMVLLLKVMAALPITVLLLVMVILVMVILATIRVMNLPAMIMAALILMEDVDHFQVCLAPCE
jgi:hypothetical protein